MSYRVIIAFVQQVIASTTVGTVNVDDRVLRKLAVEAKLSGLSLEYLVNDVLEDHLSFYRHIKRSRAITVNAFFIGMAFNQIPDQTVRRIGRILGREQPERTLANFGMDHTLDNAVKLVQEIFGRRANLFEAKIEKRKSIWDITLHHGINRKWSIFISEFVSAIFGGLGASLVKAKIEDFRVELQIRMPLHESAKELATPRITNS